MRVVTFAMAGFRNPCMFSGEPNQDWFCLTLVGMATPTRVGSCGTVETLGDTAPL